MSPALLPPRPDLSSLAGIHATSRSPAPGRFIPPTQGWASSIVPCGSPARQGCLPCIPCAAVASLAPFQPKDKAMIITITLFASILVTSIIFAWLFRQRIAQHLPSKETMTTAMLFAAVALLLVVVSCQTFFFSSTP